MINSFAGERDGLDFRSAVWAAVVAAVGLASCAESPPPNPAYGPGFSATSARPVRLELAAYNPDGRCSSPFPLTQVRAKLFTGEGTPT